MDIGKQDTTPVSFLKVKRTADKEYQIIVSLLLIYVVIVFKVSRFSVVSPST